MMWW